MKKTNKNTKLNKKILESKKIIQEEKRKIKLEKKNIRERKLNKFKNTKLGKFLFVFKDDKNSYTFSELFVVTVISLAIGAFACFSVVTVFTGGRNYFRLSKELGKFFDVYETIVDSYYDEVDKEKLVEEAIDGMVSSVGDVYTSYTDTEGVEQFNQLVGGVYEGIGCTIQLQEDGVKVIEVFENGPADKAGLMVDDIILKVDDIDVNTETDVNQLSNYIKNESDGKLIMEILRGEDKKMLNIKRDKVETPVITTTVYEKNDKKIGYMSISLFSSVAAKQFKNKLELLEKENIQGLVIDVRNNNGGYLTTVSDIVSQLLPKGEIIYQMELDGKRDVTKDKTNMKREYPIAILTNGNSASASEILAASIKESYGGFVVGTKTYGKGTVQQVKELSDGSMIKYTVENWLTPDGNWIDGKGVEPTDIVELDDIYYDDPTVDNDNQLQKALELVSK